MNIHTFLAVVSALALCLVSASVLEHSNNYLLSFCLLGCAIIVGRYAGRQLDRINK